MNFHTLPYLWALSSAAALRFHTLCSFMDGIKREARDECLRNQCLECSFDPEKHAGKNHLFSHSKWSMKWTRSHKRWCNRRAPITCEMQSTTICENKATRAPGRRWGNDAFSSPSALFQGYYRTNGWIYGVLMCHDSVNHVFFPISFLLSDEAGWEKIFIKLKEQAVKKEERIKIQVAVISYQWSMKML